MTKAIQIILWLLILACARLTFQQVQAIPTTTDAGRTTTNAERTSTNAGLTTTDALSTTRDAVRTTTDALRTTRDALRTTTDAGSTTTTAGSTTTTAGSTTRDAGSTTPDAGSTTPEAGSTTMDAGSTTTDAGSTTMDAGSTTTDAGSTTTDAGSTTITDDGRTTTDDPCDEATTVAPEPYPSLMLRNTLSSLVLYCICFVESNCSFKAPCNADPKTGLLKCGKFQMDEAYWINCGSPGTDFESCAKNWRCSENCVYQYLQKNDKLVRPCPTCEEYGRIHRGGVTGCKDKSTEDFGAKVKECCKAWRRNSVMVTRSIAVSLVVQLAGSFTSQVLPCSLGNTTNSSMRTTPLRKTAHMC